MRASMCDTGNGILLLLLFFFSILIFQDAVSFFIAGLAKVLRAVLTLTSCVIAESNDNFMRNIMKMCRIIYGIISFFFFLLGT